MAIKLKSAAEIEIMREGGKITAGALRNALAAVEPGVSLLGLDKIIEDFILVSGGEPAFKRVPGYSFTTCLNVNEGVVHGIPNERQLKAGDILSIDLGTYYKGFNTDCSWSVLVEGMDTETQEFKERRRFLETGEWALREAIAQCQAGNRVKDISRAMETVLRQRGYTPVRVLVGHGVGKVLHEDPQIPCYVAEGDKGSPKLKEGMTLAIEVIYTAGDFELKVAPDGWTLETMDGSLAGLFEHSVAVTSSGPIVLTTL